MEQEIIMNNEKDITIEPETDADNVKDPAEAIKKLKGELTACRKEREEYLSGWQRAKADFINARKDEEKARAAFVKFANEGFIEEMLPVLQNFERAVNNPIRSMESAIPTNLPSANRTSNGTDASWRRGIEHIYAQFRAALQKSGVELLEPKIGDVFDPSRHASIGTVVVAAEAENHTVREVVEKGFSLHGKVLEPAKVKVGEHKT